ncbi:MAG: hypothetical protein CYPHOPRED_000674 [Cyphobasidiales sp. Tagirdzhanova-0007]|nr:MAG: hypothetical protein CYPHOPRED_000674 [Cyphobasidiales sp. Tagirdzhanova-0007]
MTIFVSFSENASEPDEDHLYLVDVGFGKWGLLAPIPLHTDVVLKDSTEEWHRLSLASLPKSSLMMQEESPATALPL